MQKGSPLTLRNHFIQPYRALDTLPRILLTLDVCILPRNSHTYNMQPISNHVILVLCVMNIHTWILVYCLYYHNIIMCICW